MPLNLSNYSISAARPLPIILLLDTSGSMSNNDKIKYLNKAVHDMLLALIDDEKKYENHYLVTAIGFGGDSARILFDARDVCDVAISWEDVTADGCTPLGSALTLAKSIVEDRSVIPSKSYRPMVIIVSDGMPTDSWEEPLKQFTESGRSSKCDRMAIMVGSNDDSYEDVLKQFIGDAPHEVERAENAGQLVKFFQRVTMTATQRSHSVNPNEIPRVADTGLHYDAALDDFVFN